MRGWVPALSQQIRKWTAAACLVLASPVGMAFGAGTDSPEAAVKASYIYKFAPFVQWPASAFSSPSAPLRVCVVGDDPFGNVIDRAVTGQYVGQRSIELRRLQGTDRNSDCHIMYVAGSGRQSVEQTLRNLRGTPVLTITDYASETNAKGIVHFVVRGNRVRFEIDDQAAAESNLTISSKVLSLAISVRPRA